MKLILPKFRGPTWMLVFVAVLMLVHFIMLVLLLVMGLSVRGAPSPRSTQPVMGTSLVMDYKQILTKSPCRGIDAGNVTSWQPVFIVVITAKPSATEVHSFSFLRCCLDNKFVLREENAFVDGRSVVSSWRNRKKLRALLTPLLRRASDFVPLRFHSFCPLLFRAASTFRNLVSRRDSNRLLARVRSLLRASSFRVRSNQVTIMAETDQAADLWLSASFLTGRLYNPASPALAVVHLDGESLWVSIPTRKNLTVIERGNTTRASALSRGRHSGDQTPMEVTRNPRDLQGGFDSFESGLVTKRRHKNEKRNRPRFERDESYKSAFAQIKDAEILKSDRPWTRTELPQPRFREVSEFSRGPIWLPAKKQSERNSSTMGDLQIEAARNLGGKFPSLRRRRVRNSRNYTPISKSDLARSGLRPFVSSFGSKNTKNASSIKAIFKSGSLKLDTDKHSQLFIHLNLSFSHQIDPRFKKNLSEETIRGKSYPHEIKYVEKKHYADKILREKTYHSQEIFGEKENFVDGRLGKIKKRHHLNRKTKLNPHFMMMRRSFPTLPFPRNKFISFVNTLCQSENNSSLESTNKDSNPFWLGNFDLLLHNLRPQTQNGLSWYCRRRMSSFPQKADSLRTQREVFLRKHIRNDLAAIFARHEFLERSPLTGQIRQRILNAKFGWKRKSSHLESRKERAFVNGWKTASEELKEEGDLGKNKVQREGRRPEETPKVKDVKHNKIRVKWNRKKYPRNSSLEEMNTKQDQRLQFLAGRNHSRETVNNIATEERKEPIETPLQGHPQRAEKFNQPGGQRQFFKSRFVKFAKISVTTNQDKRTSSKSPQEAPQRARKMRAMQYNNNNPAMYPGLRFSFNRENHSEEWIKMTSSVSKQNVSRHLGIRPIYDSWTGRKAISTSSLPTDDGSSGEIRGRANEGKYPRNPLHEGRGNKPAPERGSKIVAPSHTGREVDAKAAKIRQKETRHGGIVNRKRGRGQESDKRKENAKGDSDKQKNGGREERRGGRRRRGAKDKVTFRCTSARKIWLYATSFPLGIYPARVSVLLKRKHSTNRSATDSRTTKHTLYEVHPTTPLPQGPQRSPTRRRGDIPAEEEYNLNGVSSSRISVPRLSIVQTVEPHGPGPPFDGTLSSLYSTATGYFQGGLPKISNETHFPLKKEWVQNGSWFIDGTNALISNETITASSEDGPNGNFSLGNETLRTMWTLDTLNKVKNIVDSILRAIGSDKGVEKEKNEERKVEENGDIAGEKQNNRKTVATSAKGKWPRRNKGFQRFGKKRKILSDFKSKKRKRRKQLSRVKLNRRILDPNSIDGAGFTETQSSVSFNHSHLTVKQTPTHDISNSSGPYEPNPATISSVADLLFTVPNLRVIKPIVNSRINNAIKSTSEIHTADNSSRWPASSASDGVPVHSSAKSDASSLTGDEEPKERLVKSTLFSSSATAGAVSPEWILRSSCIPAGSQGRININEKSYLVVGQELRGNRTNICWQEVSNIVRKYITVPPIGNKDVLATAAFYFVASSANLISGSNVSGGYVETWQFRAAADEACARPAGQIPDPLACLDYQFMAALLLVGFGIPPHRPIMVYDDIGGFQLNSALGTALDYLQGH